MVFRARLIFFLLVYFLSFSSKSQVIDTAFVGSERNYGTIGAPNSSYIWGVDNAFIVSDPSLANIKVQWNEPFGLRPIWVMETNEIGCYSDTIKAFVYIKELDTLYLPNAFTPDGDGLNDIFIPLVSDKNISSYQFRVYNRWGVLVFESNSIKQGWDGNYFGTSWESGLYTWYIQVEKNFGESWYNKGVVKIIR
ncbi:MAG: gliding motility-associated C-terminal domain-containing protein [Bacteroidetes bacterium]|nr:gliding motility-associated C-terminal domain-containing protein [Bacteroidota bacterium]